MTDKKVAFQPIDGYANIFVNKNNVGADLKPLQGKKGKDLPKYTNNDVLFEGRKIEIAIWERIDKNGRPYLSVGLKDAREALEQRYEQAKERLANRSEVPEAVEDRRGEESDRFRNRDAAHEDTRADERSEAEHDEKLPTKTRARRKRTA